MGLRSGVKGLLAAAAMGFPVVAALVGWPAPAAGQMPPDQERLVVFELFTPPEAASGG